MLKIMGVVLLLTGSTGMGWVLKREAGNHLEELYRLREILKMLQNEIIYHKASLPEACRRIGTAEEAPYRQAFLEIHEEMYENHGESFDAVWKRHMTECMKKVPVSAQEKEILVGFGSCASYSDERAQAQTMDAYIHKLELSAAHLEKELENKCRVIMSLSVMGGLLTAVILL